MKHKLFSVGLFQCYVVILKYEDFKALPMAALTEFYYANADVNVSSLLRPCILLVVRYRIIYVPVCIYSAWLKIL